MDIWLQRYEWFFELSNQCFNQGNLKGESVVAAIDLAVTYGGELLYLWIFS